MRGGRDIRICRRWGWSRRRSCERVGEPVRTESTVTFRCCSQGFINISVETLPLCKDYPSLVFRFSGDERFCRGREGYDLAGKFRDSIGSAAEPAVQLDRIGGVPNGEWDRSVGPREFICSN